MRTLFTSKNISLDCLRISPNITGLENSISCLVQKINFEIPPIICRNPLIVELKFNLFLDQRHHPCGNLWASHNRWPQRREWMGVKLRGRGVICKSFFIWSYFCSYLFDHFLWSIFWSVVPHIQLFILWMMIIVSRAGFKTGSKQVNAVWHYLMLLDIKGNP